VTEKDSRNSKAAAAGTRPHPAGDGHLETTVLKVNQRDSSGDLSGTRSTWRRRHRCDGAARRRSCSRSAEGRVLLEIDDALRRIYARDYGTARPAATRSRVRGSRSCPKARLCISCKKRRSGNSGARCEAPRFRCSSASRGSRWWADQWTKNGRRTRSSHAPPCGSWASSSASPTRATPASRSASGAGTGSVLLFSLAAVAVIVWMFARIASTRCSAGRALADPRRRARNLVDRLSTGEVIDFICSAAAVYFPCSTLPTPR